MTSCYDHPRFYDLAYSSDMAGETGFIKALLGQYCGENNHLNILEPACGTGRVLLPLLRDGHTCTGIDNNRAALDYFAGRLSRAGLSAVLHEMDMTGFSIGMRQFDAAVCTVDSFRHLLTESAALQHLQCIAGHLKKGGIYLLGLSLLPQNGYTTLSSRGRVTGKQCILHTTITVLDVNRKQRQEILSIVYNVQHRNKREKYRYIYTLRTYTLRQILDLLKKLPEFTLTGSYEYYDFDMTQKIRLDNQTEDVMLVLKKI